MDSNKKDFKFDKRAASYDDGFEGRASRKFYNLLLREIKIAPGASVLDVGCGTGALLKKLSVANSVACFGIDVEENMIAEAKSKCSHMNFQLSHCDKIPFENQSFDAIIACMAYHHFDNKEGFAIEAARLLKPGGVLYIADPRFPLPIRKVLNGILRLLRITGEFYTPDEIASRFSVYGLDCAGFVFDGYVQVVKLRQKQ